MQYAAVSKYSHYPAVGLFIQENHFSNKICTELSFLTLQKYTSYVHIFSQGTNTTEFY